MKARPKPIEFNAIRWHEEQHRSRMNPTTTRDELTGVRLDFNYPGKWPGDPPAPVVDTPMGRETVGEGDWILTAPDDTRYHYTDDVFTLLFDLTP